VRKISIRAVVLALTLCTSPALVFAQQSARFQGGALDEGSKKLGVGQQRGDLSQFGHVLAPGLVFSPTLTLEAGHDSNPDLFFSDAEATPYGLANLTGVFGFIRDTGATTLTLRGTSLQYDGDIEISDRWDAGFALDNAYAVAPGTIATFGGYYIRDEISLIPSDNEGGYGQLAYKEADYEAFARLKLDQIGYLGSEPALAGQTATQVALAQPSQFNVQRAEGVTGLIVGPDADIGYYGELGGANLDYYSQGAESVLDRDATEFWAIGGVRFNLKPTVVLDTGWRFNARQTEDPFLGDVTTNFFDGRLTWTPQPDLQFVAEVDRSFVEPITTLGVVGDKIHYGAAVVYKARADVELSGSLSHDQIDQLGDTSDYHETGVAASISYLWNEKISIYGVVSQTHSEEQVTGDTADRLRVGAGTRIQF
jgi:hypothetical protein